MSRWSGRAGDMDVRRLGYQDRMGIVATQRSYDQAASAKWHNVWLFQLVFFVAVLGWRLLGIERAIREARIEVRVQGGEVTP